MTGEIIVPAKTTLAPAKTMAPKNSH